jgi:hypothetical protein
MEDENPDQENKIIVNFENNTTINDIEDVPPTEEIKIKKKILKKSKVKLENIEETPINNTSEIKIKKTPKKIAQESKEEEIIKEQIPESEIKNKKIVKELIKCSNCNKFLTEKSLKYSHNCTIAKVKKGPLRIIKRNNDNNDNNTEISPPPPPPLVKNCFSTNILNSRMNKIKKDQERNSNLLINAF